MTASFSPFLPHHQIALGELALRLHALRDLSEISRGEGGLETEGGSQLFETAEKGGVKQDGNNSHFSIRREKLARKRELA